MEVEQEFIGGNLCSRNKGSQPLAGFKLLHKTDGRNCKMGRKADLMIGVCSCTMLFSISLAAAESPDLQNRLRDKLLDYFARDHLVPIFRDLGLEVGDVMSPNGELIAKRSDCFPTMTIPSSTGNNQHEELTLDLEAEGSFGVGIVRVIKAMLKLSAGGSNTLDLSFDGLESKGVSETDLRKAYDKSACPMLAPVLDGDAVRIQRNQKIPLIIQQIYYARKTLTARTGDKATAEAVLDDVKAHLGSGYLKAGVSKTNAIYIATKDKVPVAVRIAMLPVPMNVTLGAGDQPNSNPTIYEWKSFSHDKHTHTYEAGLRTLDRAIRNATSGELNPLREENPEP
jgi:hypothetical protein